MVKWLKRAAYAAVAFVSAGSVPAKAANIDVLLALPTNTLTFTSAFLAEDRGFYKWTLDAGLLDPANRIKSYKGLWTDAFAKWTV